MQKQFQLGSNVWPAGKRAAVMFTFDFDVESLQTSGFVGPQIIFADRSRGEYSPYEGLARCLSMLERQAIKGTFFVPGYVMERYPQQTLSIVKAGHELACHGYAHNDFHKPIPVEEERDNMARAEALIKTYANKMPVGYRAAGGFMQPYMVDLLAERGYLYSSANTPLKCCDWTYAYEKDGIKLPLVEFATDVMLDDFPYFSMILSAPAHHNPCNNDTVLEIWKEEFDGRAEEGNKFMVLKLHPAIIGRASRIRMLETLVDHMQESGAWIATCEEVARYVLAQNGLL
ncbi:MAG: polysaccharide deacetylase [Clostridia bacterium]|nr:polysaccharide deacetylase [Clostridia bacterium]